MRLWRLRCPLPCGYCTRIQLTFSLKWWTIFLISVVLLCVCCCKVSNIRPCFSLSSRLMLKLLQYFTFCRCLVLWAKSRILFVAFIYPITLQPWNWPTFFSSQDILTASSYSVSVVCNGDDDGHCKFFHGVFRVLLPIQEASQSCVGQERTNDRWCWYRISCGYRTSITAKEWHKQRRFEAAERAKSGGWKKFVQLIFSMK